jgi:acid stress chaperone HdeB
MARRSMLLKAVNAALIGGALLAAAGPVHGQTLDLATLKCKDFIELSKETVTNVTTWLDGYFTDEEDAAIFERDKLKAKAEKLAAYCAQNPRMGLMTAAENVMAK